MYESLSARPLRLPTFLRNISLPLHETRRADLLSSGRLRIGPRALGRCAATSLDVSRPKGEEEQLQQEAHRNVARGYLAQAITFSTEVAAAASEVWDLQQRSLPDAVTHCDLDAQDGAVQVLKSFRRQWLQLGPLPHLRLNMCQTKGPKPCHVAAGLPNPLEPIASNGKK